MLGGLAWSGAPRGILEAHTVRADGETIEWRALAAGEPRRRSAVGRSTREADTRADAVEMSGSDMRAYS
jgi:hypothetical protein